MVTISAAFFLLFSFAYILVYIKMFNDIFLWTGVSGFGASFQGGWVDWVGEQGMGSTASDGLFCLGPTRPRENNGLRRGMKKLRERE